MSNILETQSQPEIVLPDQNRLGWGDYFMGIACLVAERSCDPHTKVGALLCSPDNRILASGYNGLPKNIPSEKINFSRTNADPCLTKYPFIIHAEENALLSCKEDLTGSILYTTLFCCNECAKLLIQKNVSKVYYLKNPYAGTWQIKASSQLFSWAGVSVEQFIPEREQITINLKEPE